MKTLSCAVAAVCVGMSAVTVGPGVAGGTPSMPSTPVLASSPTGIGFEWDDDDDDWSQTVTWECPTGCSITFEDDY